MKQKIVCFILAIMMIATLGVTAFADETPNYASMSNEMLSEISGITIEELIEAREMYGEDFVEVITNYMERCCNIDNQGTISYSAGNSGGEMSDEDWNRLCESFRPGQILITDQENFTIYNHGHAAILYNRNYTIEHLGNHVSTNVDPNTGKHVSQYYHVTWWKDKYNRIKTLNYTDTTTMTNAASYAYHYLRGLEYNALAKRNSDKVNCATLVWKAYNNYGINIVHDTSYNTIIPWDLDISPKLRTICAIDWDNVSWGF